MREIPTNPPLVSGAAPLVKRALKAFSEISSDAVEDEESPMCNVQSILGVYRVNIENLLYFVALESYEGELSGGATIELTEDMVDVALEAVRSLREYLMVDLIGLLIEAEWSKRLGGELKKSGALEKRIGKKIARRRLVPGDTATWEKIFKHVVYDPSQQKIVDLEATRYIFGKDRSWLLIPKLTKMFLGLISDQGLIGRQRWERFINTELREKRPKGRPRNKTYDELFALRTKNPKKETYGALALRYAAYAKIDVHTSKDRVKSALRQRERKSMNIT